MSHAFLYLTEITAVKIPNSTLRHEASLNVRILVLKNVQWLNLHGDVGISCEQKHL